MSKMLAAVALVALVGANAAAGIADPGSPSAVVSTRGGPLGGVVNDGIAAYEGIPYAAPPVGELRWRAPQPPAPWRTTREAVDYGPSCPQSSPPSRVPDGSRARGTSEDCLTLNVWTPVARAHPLPVMVWLHGGSNVAGSGSSTYYAGTSFARDGIVFVTLNYRLGLLGFFAHPALVREAGRTPAVNFGLLDQIAALGWVRDNIARFGGDPANVTLFGESAGGLDTAILSVSDAARGLFARAIVESGPIWFPPHTLAQAQTQSALVAAGIGLSGDRATPAALRALPLDAIVKATDQDALGPILDGDVIKRPIVETLAKAAHVPTIIGTNDGDGSLVQDVVDARALFPQLPANDLRIVRASYAAAGIDGPNIIAMHLFGDGAFAAPARWFARTSTAAGQPAYLYRFDYVASFFTGRRFAAVHGSEIPYVFASWPIAVPLTETDRAVETAMHACWVAFARTGVPACAGASDWRPYDAHARRVMIFDAAPSVRDPGDTETLDALERGLYPRVSGSP